MIERVNVGDTGRLNRDEDCINIIKRAEVIKTPQGEGDVWGFRCLDTGNEMFTSERFTFWRDKKEPTDDN